MNAPNQLRGWKRALRRAWLAGACFASSTACSNTQVEHVSWDPLTTEEVVETLRSPTATLPDTISEEVLGTIESTLPAVVEAARFLGHVSYVLGDLSDTDHAEAESQLPPPQPAPSDDSDTWGTSFFLRLACPGQTTAPPFEFGVNGSARIDSPALYGIDIDALLAGGELLFTFDECMLGTTRLSAAIPARYVLDFSNVDIDLPPGDPDLPASAVALDFDVPELESPIGIVGFACGSSTTTCQDDVRVAAEVKGRSGFYVLAMRVTESLWAGSTTLDLEIRGENRVAACEVAVPTSAWSQTPPQIVCDQ